ncbi:MAG TPA: PAS domain-containing protein, partial [Candidatus Synoicihabitans sp.]|nr:PAS domain-containing protein [Candidatus Synoicihabitans sp.]
MTSTSQPSGATRVCRRIARGGAGGAIGIGFIVLVGWIFGIEALPRLALGCAPMEASTALGVMFSGLALWLLLDESRLTRPRRVAVRALAVTVLAIAASTVVGSVQQRDFGLEHLLFPDQSAAAQAGPMAVTTAAGFVGYALALLLAISRVHRAALVAQVLAAFVAGHALLALAAYLYGATDSVGQSARGGLAPLGLITSIVFLGLSTSLICARPHFGLAATLGSPRVGGVMARCILPLTVLLPFVVGGLRLAGEVSGAFDTRFGVALFATVNAVLFSVIVWLSARWLNRTDAARQHAQEETLAAMRNLHQAHQQLQHGKQLLRLAVTNARIGTWLWTPADDRIVASELWFELHGLRPAPHSTREQMLAHIHPDDREHVLRGGENAVRARGEYEAEYRTIS